jgi:TetR/AcrR family transcriptional regulator, mexJK operon transcriptional repressor
MGERMDDTSGDSDSARAVGVGLPGRSARKRQAIFEAARTVFLRDGYGGANMDSIAAMAQVSKQTVYKHFVDKEQLFAEIIEREIREAERHSEGLLADLAASEDIEDQLRRFAREHIVVVTQPHVMRMRRMIIGEADRFPALSRSWYERAPGRGHAVLAEQFAELDRQGRLSVPDPLLAAQNFNWLILSVPMNEAMFQPAAEPHPVAELERYADEAVRVFLAAYAPAPGT